MSLDVEIVELKEPSPLLDEVERLFFELYDYMKSTGLLMPLVEDGEKIWRRSIEKTMGRYAKVLVAVKGNVGVGFAHGSFRFAPDFLGGHKVGYINHIYVSPDARVKGLGRRLLSKLEAWFDEKQVHSYELQVLCDNELGIAFWERHGYQKELFQMRKLLK